MPSYTEEDLIDAIFDITDNGYSLRKSAIRWNIPPMTISDRMNGKTKPKSEVLQPSQRLSPQQEEKVVQWILKQELLGFVPVASTVRCVVEGILKQQHDLKPLGRKWIEGFKRRNPSIHTKIGRSQETARFNGFTTKSVN